MKKILTVSLMLALCLVLLSSCAGVSLTGSWSSTVTDADVNAVYTLTFNEGGTYTYTGLNEGEATPTDLMSGAYQTDGDLLILDRHAARYAVNGDTLTVTVHGVDYTFTRDAAK